MRHSIAVKFLSLCLAALCLLTAIFSGAAIVGLAAEDLYDNSFDEYYSDALHDTRQNFAVQLIHRYVSLNLGNLPEEYLNDYHGIDWMYDTFRYGYFYYTIYNELGEAVESTMADAPAGGTRYEMVVTKLRYRALVEIIEKQDGNNVIYIEPQATEDVSNTEMPEGAAEEVRDQAANATIPTSAYQVTRGEDIYYGEYYDYEKQDFVEFTFIYRDLPPYTVELYLMPEAMPEEYAWTLARQIWTVRNELFWVLGISVLLFAVLMVVLCCAAGHKRGSTEVKAGGLNALPLDAYLAGAGFLVACAVSVGSEVLYHLLRYSPGILIPVAVMIGYGTCVLIVAFFFACAAQFKTPGGYWWRHSLCGLCLRLIFWLWNKLIDGCVWLGARLPGGIKRSGALMKRSGKGLLGLIRGLCVWTLELCETILRWCWRMLKRICRKCFDLTAAFCGLLPLMWQWLLAGAALLVVLAFALGTRSEGMTVLSVCAGLALIVYGALCFGSLMDGAKRMSKGDLDTKVNDRNMLGAFKEFAGDLNALADVAMVAAQKQLRSERMKTELITNVSHDIKTPLTSIINYVDLLQKPHTEEEQEQYLEVLSRQSGQLKKLIDDLMEMSKASTGNMAVEITAVNAVETVNQALGEFADKLDKVQLTPVVRQPELPLYIKADGRLAWRVLSNLLSNACKYALPGTRLYIDLTESDGKVLISLKNISREELNVSADELLERFVRGDASRNTEGSGLGLNIAKSLMELQKGQLELTVDGDLFKATLIFPVARME